MKAIRLPNGKRVPLGTYARAWKALRALPADAECPGFYHFPERADTILREMARGLDDRINRHLPAFGNGRKWGDNWQRETANAARELRDWHEKRTRLHWLPSHLSRFSHLIARGDE